ncbi:MAG: M56 family metallopeptidase [Clostridia bacterium]|nr:M56 family metallopeptidase [Clostridia bacterium]
MIRLIYTLLLLTVLFSLTAALMLLFRKAAKGGKGQLMRLLWLAVLFLAVIPLRIGVPIFRFSLDETVPAPEKVLTEADSADSRPVPSDRISPLSDLMEISLERVSWSEFPVAMIHAGPAVERGCAVLSAAWLLGAVIAFAKELLQYRQLINHLTTHSVPVCGGALDRVFSACRETLHLKRPVRLRLVSRVMPITPCVCGIFRPTVYIGENCISLDSRELSYIFTHELCHVKRRDTLYKRFAAMVFSVHWFNPVTKSVRFAVGEDIEHACDAAVLQVYGDTHLADYMESILSAAERMKKSLSACAAVETGLPPAALFMAKEASPNYLKRRYLYMKRTCDNQNHRKLTVFSALILVLIIALNAAVMSACGYAAAGNSRAPSSALPPDADVGYGYSPIDNAIHNYFQLREDKAPDEAQLAEITSIDVYFYSGYDLVLPMIVINGDFCCSTMPGRMTVDTYQNVVLPAMEVLDAKSGGEARYSNKTKAFFMLKDPADPTLTEGDLTELLTMYPELAEDGATCLFDPYATVREQLFLLQCFCQSGLVYENMLTEAGIRAELAKIPALASAAVTFHETEDIHLLDDLLEKALPEE